jgi:beta-glucosidase
MMTETTQPTIPFVWGVSTASYQIEGGAAEGGRGPSIWDTFSHTPGKTEDGATGDVACDHYHQWASDVDLMAQLGVQAYRFSLSWSRVMPEGKGTVNETGLAFYSRLVDALLSHNITPFITLYHWDLPQALQDSGGWLNRDTSYRFADYADLMVRHLGDRVQHWITLNEPFVTMHSGYVIGRHAPGLTDLANALPVMHHQLLGHGIATQALRSHQSTARVGIAYSLTTAEPDTDREEDIAAAAFADAYHNRSGLDPVLRGQWPEELAALVTDAVTHPDDLRVISAPIDFIGVNYYRRIIVRAPAKAAQLNFEQTPLRLKPLTEMGWEVYPQGLEGWLKRLHTDYPGHTLYITENGTAFPDTVDATGQVYDPQRRDYLRAHIAVVEEARRSGIPVQGYFVWSLMDNFEWAFGYRPRFGIIYVDYATQQRIIKESGRWYARFIATGNLDEA